MLEKIFPESRYCLPLNSTSAAGNHLQIRNPRWIPTDDKRRVDQVFLGGVLGNNVKLDFTSYLGGSIYVGGYGAEPQILPKSAESVRAQPSYVEDMKALASSFIDLPTGAALEILSTGRCYRPAAKPNRPIIAKVPMHELYPHAISRLDLHPYYRSDKTGGLFVSTGHNSDGVTIAPGSGKVMAELLLGMEPSINISGLGL